jgi:hypothetical protein
MSEEQGGNGGRWSTLHTTPMTGAWRAGRPIDCPCSMCTSERVVAAIDDLDPADSDTPQAAGDLVEAMLSPAEYITDPDRAEQLGLTVEARRMREARPLSSGARAWLWNQIHRGQR